MSRNNTDHRFWIILLVGSSFGWFFWGKTQYPMLTLPIIALWGIEYLIRQVLKK